MEIIETKAYITECGKKYWSRSGATKHEGICQCWKNPKFKTCASCEHGRLDGNYDDWGWKCQNDEFVRSRHFNKAENDKTNSLCINCPKWEQRL